MAEAGMTTLIDRATEFFSPLDSSPAAGEPVSSYPLELLLSTPHQRLSVELRDGRPGPVSEAPDDLNTGYWTLEFRGEQPVFEGIFAGALTLGEALYAGILVAPEEKAKHNLVCALGQTIRLVQDVHRRARDPRNPGLPEKVAK